MLCRRQFWLLLYIKKIKKLFHKLGVDLTVL